MSEDPAAETRVPGAGLRLVYVHGSPVRAGAANSIQVVRMCSAFRRQGADIVLVVPRTQDALPTDRYPEYFGPEARDLPVRLLRKLRRGSTIQYTAEAALQCRRERAGLVYTRSVVVAAATSLLGLPTVFEAHAPVKALGRLADLSLRIALRTRAFRGVVSISAALAAAMERDYPRLAGRQLVAHDGADVPEPGPDPEPRPGTARLKVGYLGQLYPGKGVELIARLATRSAHEFRVLGGPEPLADEWRARAASDNLRFDGPIAPAEAAAALRTFDVLLAPYGTSVRGRNRKVDIAAWMSPLKIFEYMGSGRPMVASDLPVLREVLRDGENALLCPPEDAEAWAGALDRLAADPDLCRRLARTARRDLESRHSWDRRARSILQFSLERPTRQPGGAA